MSLEYARYKTELDSYSRSVLVRYTWSISMTLIALLIGLVVIALLCWLVKTYMPGPFQTPALVILITIAIIWVLVSFFPAIGNVRVR